MDSHLTYSSAMYQCEEVPDDCVPIQQFVRVDGGKVHGAKMLLMAGHAGLCRI